MKAVINFLKKVLLVIELFFVILIVHWEKVLFVGIIALDQFSKLKIVQSMSLGGINPHTRKFFPLHIRTKPRRGIWNFAQSAGIFFGNRRGVVNFIRIFFPENQQTQSAFKIWLDKFGERLDGKSD